MILASLSKINRPRSLTRTYYTVEGASQSCVMTYMGKESWEKLVYVSVQLTRFTVQRKLPQRCRGAEPSSSRRVMVRAHEARFWARLCRSDRLSPGQDDTVSVTVAL